MRRYIPTDQMIDVTATSDVFAPGEYVRVEDLPRWIPVANIDIDLVLNHAETLWVFDGKKVALAEFIYGNGFNTVGTSCDREGLNSERLTGITHYMRLVEPAPPEVL